MQYTTVFIERTPIIFKFPILKELINGEIADNNRKNAVNKQCHSTITNIFECLHCATHYIKCFPFITLVILHKPMKYLLLFSSHIALILQMGKLSIKKLRDFHKIIQQVIRPQTYPYDFQAHFLATML